MASQPIDQGAILQSGAGSVQNFAAELIRQQLANAQTTQSQAQMISAQTAHLTQQLQAQRLAAYQTRVAQLGDRPTLDQMAGLVRDFPGETSDAAQHAWSMQDAGRQQRDFRSIAQIHSALIGGHPETAIPLLQGRIDADREAGLDSHEDQLMLQGLQSGDPAQISNVALLARRAAATAAGPDKFASVYGADDPHVSTVGPGDIAIQSNAPGGPRVMGQSPIARTVQGVNGSTYVVGPTPNVPLLGGGQISSPTITPSGTPPLTPAPAPVPQAGNLPRNGQAMPTGMFQGWQVIGVPGDPRRRAGGVTVPHNGVDFRPPANNPHLVADRPLDITAVQPDHGISGITAIVHFPDGAQFNLMHLAAEPRPGHYEAGQVVATAGNTGNARNGSTQIHVQPWGGTQHDPRAYFGGGVGTASSPIRVNSVQQARSLAPGTPYSTPDGRRFVR